MTKVVVLSLVCIIQMAVGGPQTESYKDQYCTDPRTMRKHAAYTEWADAYSCTRHRCQPGGRNLAIYTVGCKRVEAPESAIECEEVVEDTNMQFPFCCTRLRCLVVVRGEVWTRVLGQPWEALPAAPWSHMYKMKRPPPADGSFLPKTPDVGPVYELAESEKQEKVLRADDSTDCNEVKPAVAPAPDIVIALSTNPKEHKNYDEGGERVAPRYLALSAGSGTNRRQHKARAITTPASFYVEPAHELDTAMDIEEFPNAVTTEKPGPVVMRAGDGEVSSDEKYFANSFGVTQKIKTAPPKSDHWTEIPMNQWNEHDPLDADSKLAPDHEQDLTWTIPEASTSKDPLKEPPPSNLQALVDAIGTRMRDIESVVQKMSDKVHDTNPDLGSGEKRQNDVEVHIKKKLLKTSPDSNQYKRFSIRNRGSKYLRTSEPTTDVPLFVVDNHRGAGYFSDASNSVLRRASGPKEPPQTYMAPVETRRKGTDTISDDESDKKHKKHAHKKKKSKRGHKKHRNKEEKRKRFNKISSSEKDNVVSLEDSSAVDGHDNVSGELRPLEALHQLKVMEQTRAPKISKDLNLGSEHKVHKLILRRYIKQFHLHEKKLRQFLYSRKR